MSVVTQWLIFSFWVFRSIQIDSKMIFWKCYLKKTLFTYHLVPNSSQIGPKFGKLGSGGAKTTLWSHCWGCKPPHSASHIHNTCIWSVWAPSYAVERHLGAPLHRHDGSGGGQILENWGQAELRRHCFDFVEAVNHPTLHHTSIIHAYKVPYGRVVRWSLGMSEVLGWNPAGVGASRRSRSGKPRHLVHSLVFANIFPFTKQRTQSELSKICSAYGISYIFPYDSNTRYPFVPNFM